jgi:hypothetical protein
MKCRILIVDKIGNVINLRSWELKMPWFATRYLSAVSSHEAKNIRKLIELMKPGNFHHIKSIISKK